MRLKKIKLITSFLLLNNVIMAGDASDEVWIQYRDQTKEIKQMAQDPNVTYEDFKRNVEAFLRFEEENFSHMPIESRKELQYGLHGMLKQSKMKELSKTIEGLDKAGALKQEITDFESWGQTHYPEVSTEKRQSISHGLYAVLKKALIEELDRTMTAMSSDPDITLIILKQHADDFKIFLQTNFSDIPTRELQQLMLGCDIVLKKAEIEKLRSQGQATDVEQTELKTLLSSLVSRSSKPKFVLLNLTIDEAIDWTEAMEAQLRRRSHS